MPVEQPHPYQVERSEPCGIVLSVDQIDDRTDTFRPFVPDKAEAGATPEAFLFVINAPLRYIHNIFSWK
jgi:hypothetical protein